MPINYLQVDSVLFSAFALSLISVIIMLVCAISALFPKACKKTYKKTGKSGSAIRFKATAISNKSADDQKN